MVDMSRTASVQLFGLLSLRGSTRCRQCGRHLSSLLAAPSLLQSRQAALLPTSRPFPGSSSNQNTTDSRASSTHPPTPSNTSPFITDRKKYVHVWADGACRMNGRRGARAGLGVWFGPGHHLNLSARAAPPATNNSAELQAAERAVRLARDAGFSRVLVHTDSQFVIDCATRWMKVWRRNGWRLAGGGPVKNRPQLEELARAMDGATVRWNYVRGHSDDTGNTEADRLAVAAIQDVPSDTAVAATQDVPSDTAVAATQDVPSDTAVAATQDVPSDTAVAATQDVPSDTAVAATQDVPSDTAEAATQDVPSDTAVAATQDVPSDTSTRHRGAETT